MTFQSWMEAVLHLDAEETQSQENLKAQDRKQFAPIMPTFDQ